jgi:AcrR family transcriptional regulator
VAQVSDDARTRLLDTAYDLFSHEGIRAVGVDRVVAEADVAKMTLYRHFRSKEELVLAFLELRDQRWTRDWLQAEAERRATAPDARVLTLFELLDEWFQRKDFESCAFVRVLLETFEDRSPAYMATVRHLDAVRALVTAYAEQAGVRDPAELASEIQILMLGAIMSATRGDRAAARRARRVAELLLESATRS